MQQEAKWIHRLPVLWFGCSRYYEYLLPLTSSVNHQRSTGTDARQVVVNLTGEDRGTT
jgi:hypothetical protein